MNGLQERSQRAYKIGQINGKAIVIKSRLERALSSLDFEGDEENAEKLIKNSIMLVEEISKLTHTI